MNGFQGSNKKSINQGVIIRYFFSTFCTVEKCGVTPYCLYRDSLTLRKSPISNF